MRIDTVEDTIHNVINRKKVVRKLMKVLKRKYRHYKIFWENYEIEKDFHIVPKK